MPEIDDQTRKARLEAAAKLGRNHDVVVNDILKNSGIVRVTCEANCSHSTQYTMDNLSFSGILDLISKIALARFIILLVLFPIIY